MGIYSEYLNRGMSFPEITAERKAQLMRLSKLRNGRDVLVYAADSRKANNAPVLILPEDLLPIGDQLANLKGSAIDVIIETPGGYAEVVEDIIRLLRDKYTEVAFIVPGMAKSAGTIMVMYGDEILMEPASALGPIDAQLNWRGKSYSAEAFLTGLEKIKEETDSKQALNRAYIPILQNISPGEIEDAQNALAFAKTLVTNGLCNGKFKKWTTHSSTGQPVTDEERTSRAAEIADKLCKHSEWLTHGRSIKISDLENMRLKIVDYSKNQEIFDAIRRYYTLLQMTFDTNIYKVFETPSSQIYRFLILERATTPISIGNKAIGEFVCGKCNNPTKIQMNFVKNTPLELGCVQYPANDMFKCPHCGMEHNLSEMRRQVELQAKKEVIR